MITLDLANHRCIYCKTKPLRCKVVKEYDKNQKRVKCMICSKEQIIELTPKKKPKKEEKKPKKEVKK